ncbi:MAG: transcriptional repressor [Phycisphaerae bacterium]|nr:transcriptional repressor [Phycisphaerae bacterium]
MKKHRLDSRLDQFEQICRQRGLSLTVPRRAIFESMQDRKDHPTADQVYADIKTKLPGISRTSVYRVLEMLVDIGMLTKVCHPGSAARFDPQSIQHHHLVCMNCERIIDVRTPRLDDLPLPDVRTHGFRIHDYHICFRGTCSDCLKKQKTNTRPADQSAKDDAQS